MHTSKISLCIPVYGVENYIERCARSLFEQTLDDIEYIFVDDCTKDQSISVLLSVIEQYPHRKQACKIIKHDVNRGLSAARNTALKASTGEYVMHVDSDDFLNKNALSLMYDLAVKENSDIVVADEVEVYHKRTHQRPYLYSEIKEEYLSLLLCRKANAQIAGKLMRRKLLMDNSLMSVEQISMGEDYVLYPRIVYYASKISRIRHNSYFYVQNSNSIMHSVKKKAIDDLYNAEKVLIDFFIKREGVLDDSILCKSMLYNKISMYYIAPLSLYKYINEYYLDVQWRKLQLPLPIKIILFFSEKKYSSVIWFLSVIRNLLRN